MENGKQADFVKSMSTRRTYEEIIDKADFLNRPEKARNIQRHKD
jgi:hypothetical protein